MKKYCLLPFLLFVVFVIQGCSGSGGSGGSGGKGGSSSGPVSIRNCGNYFEVIINFDKEPSHRAVGEAYGEALKQACPNYEALMESYVMDNLMLSAMLQGNSDPTEADAKALYPTVINTVKSIKGQVPKDYQEEMEGLASKLTGGSSDELGDKKISLNELYAFNILGDILSPACSALAVYGSRSRTGRTLTAYVHDIYCGSRNQLSQLQAVTIIHTSNKTVCLIGYLTELGAHCGFTLESNGIFGASLSSDVNGFRSNPEGKSAPFFDFRYALEHYRSIEDVSEHLRSKRYMIGDLWILSDQTRSIVLENDLFSGHRSIRTAESSLNPGIEWGINNAVAAVNAFVLSGNTDNFHAIDPQNPYDPYLDNEPRWANLYQLVKNKGDNPIDSDELKRIAGYNGEDGVSNGEDPGDIYNVMTQFIVLFDSGTLNVEVAFRPRTSNDLPPNTPRFEKIPIARF